MPILSSTVAIAALSSRVLDVPHTSEPRAGAIAALTVTGEPDDLTFSLSTHIPSSPARLTHWVDDLVAHDPMLVGYRLPRTSRLLTASGYIRRLAGTFSREGQYDVLDVLRGRPTPLSTIALMHGVMAVDEEALFAARPIGTDVAAGLALVNAVASWIVYVGRVTPGKAGRVARRQALRQLGAALSDTPAHELLLTAMTCSAQ
jgi:hypothetical protein